MPFAVMVAAVVVGNVIHNIVGIGLEKFHVITVGWAQRLKERETAKSSTIQ